MNNNHEKIYKAWKLTQNYCNEQSCNNCIFEIKINRSKAFSCCYSKHNNYYNKYIKKAYE